MLKELVREEWWTDTTVRTDADGYADVEAFKGDYEFASSDAKAAAVLDNDAVSEITLS